MTTLSIENLPRPPKRYRVNLLPVTDVTKSSFETKRKSKGEDKKRELMVLKQLANAEGDPLTFSSVSLAVLAKNLQSGCGLASSRYMRKHRNRITGGLWQLIDKESESAFVATIIPTKHKYPEGMLRCVDPRALLNQLRSALIREGADKAEGWLFVAIHGEHDPTTGDYQIHYHLAGTRDQREVIDRLRKRKAYKSVRKKEREPGEAYQRVKLTRKPLYDMPGPITYLVQSFWPKRPSFKLKPGYENRQRTKQRINEPYHTEVLLWLDQWNLKDITLMMGLNVCKAGLVSV